MQSLKIPTLARPESQFDIEYMKCGYARVSTDDQTPAPSAPCIEESRVRKNIPR